MKTRRIFIGLILGFFVAVWMAIVHAFYVLVAFRMGFIDNHPIMCVIFVVSCITQVATIICAIKLLQSILHSKANKVES